MKRWHANLMQTTGKKLFTKRHYQKKLAHHHEMHYMARDIEKWLPEGIQAMIDGRYDPRPLKQWSYPIKTDTKLRCLL